jgi:hypothetical protein
MIEFPSPNQENTFIVRIWHDRSASGQRWYGRVENIRTGQHIAFQEWERLADFIQDDCAIEDDNRQDSTFGG